MAPGKNPFKQERALGEAEVEYIALLGELEDSLQEAVRQARIEMPPAGYAIPVIVHILEQHANDTVDKTSSWGFADFSALFRLLAESLCDLTGGARGSGCPIYMREVVDLDPAVGSYLAACHQRIVAMNERISVAGGMLSIARSNELYRINIANSRRRSALTLLRTKAQYFQHSDEERLLLDGATKSGVKADIWLLGRITLAMNMREIDALRKGLPDTWTRLLAKLDVDEEALLTFLAFAAIVPALSHEWLEDDEAYDLLGGVAAHFDRPGVSRAQFDRLMGLFASDPETARRIGTATPFLRIGTRLLAWPFAHHALLPELVFISLVQSKRSDAWSATFGSDLAGAADYLAAQLNPPSHIKIVTRRKKAGVGDIDLGIYDTSNGSLLICEIKTVFDRFRTEFQSSNFVQDRVNFAKAVGQLNAARDALLDRRWALSDVVGIPRLAPPRKVYRMVLLWRDHINPTLDGGEFVPVCDFATFRHLFEKCQGNPDVLAESVEQLEKIFWASSCRPSSWTVGEREVNFERELESGALPPQSFLDTLSLNEVVREEVSSLVHFPEDWDLQMKEKGETIAPIFQSALA